MRTIKIKLGSLTKLIEIKTDVKTFGEFHEILAQQAGELFDLEQIDNTKFDFVVMNINTIYGQRMDAILPETDFYFLVVPRQNKGNSDFKTLEEFYKKILDEHSIEGIRNLKYNTLRQLLGKYNSIVPSHRKLDLNGSKEHLIILLSDLYKSAKESLKDGEVKQNSKEVLKPIKNNTVTIINGPSYKTITIPDCDTCKYKEHYEKEIVEAEYQRINHLKVRK